MIDRSCAASLLAESLSGTHRYKPSTSSKVAVAMPSWRDSKLMAIKRSLVVTFEPPGRRRPDLGSRIQPAGVRAVVAQKHGSLVERQLKASFHFTANTGFDHVAKMNSSFTAQLA